jgi:transposase-like protein
MKADLREIYGASTRAEAEAAIDVFAEKYAARYEQAVACLTKDREALLAFFDFPAEHWDRLRTSNPIEKRVRDSASQNGADVSLMSIHNGVTTRLPSPKFTEDPQWPS